MTRYLQFVNLKTGERDRKVDVSGKDERTVERTLMGMLINIGKGWHVEDVTIEDATA